jgi:hypothetical protein
MITVSCGHARPVRSGGATFLYDPLALRDQGETEGPGAPG